MGSDYWTTIGEIAEVFDGPHATPKKIEEGPYYLSISSLENGKLDLSKSARLSEEQFAKWTKRVTPQEGDVLFSYETRLGEAALMPSGIKACLGRRMGLLRPDTAKVDPHFFLYTYLGPDFQIEIRTKTINGATVDRIALKELPEFSIKIPPLPEQKAIAHVLGSLDDRIELNRRMNETLEGMAQALFKSWFVDFDPVFDNALASGKEIPPELKEKRELRERVKGEKGQTHPLPKEIHTLFPDEFVESAELGWIPAGWEWKKLDDAACLLDSKRIPLSKNDRSKRNGPFPYYGASGIVDYIDDYIFEGEHLLISEDGENLRSRKTPIAFIARRKFWVNNHAHILRGRNGVCIHHIMLLFRIMDINPFITGAVQPKLNQANLKQIPFLLPSRGVLDRFAELIEPLYQKIYSYEDEAITLAKLRDTLLPKLLSGEIRIPDAKKMVEELGE